MTTQGVPRESSIRGDPQAADSPAERSAREILAGLVDAACTRLLSEDGAVAYRDAAREATDAALARADFVAGPLRRWVEDVAYDLARARVTRTHRAPVSGPVSDRQSARSRFEADVRFKWRAWEVHSGSEVVTLLRATAPQLRIAALREEQAGRTSLNHGRLYRRLAGRLGDGEAVEDRWSEAELETLQVELEQTFTDPWGEQV